MFEKFENMKGRCTLNFLKSAGKYCSVRHNQEKYKRFLNIRLLHFGIIGLSDLDIGLLIGRARIHIDNCDNYKEYWDSWYLFQVPHHQEYTQFKIDTIMVHSDFIAIIVLFNLCGSTCRILSWYETVSYIIQQLRAHSYTLRTLRACNSQSKLSARALF